MKHLRLFETESSFEASKTTLEEPWVALSLDINNIYYTKKTESSIPNNEIWYTTTDGQVFNMPDLSEFGLSYEYTLLSNTYENGKGVMVFDQTVEKVHVEFDEEGNPTKLYPVFADIMSEGNSTLLSIELPNSVTSIGSNAFSNCYFAKANFINNSSLTSSGNWGATLYDEETSDGLFINSGTTAVKCRTTATSVTIPNSVISIGDGAFEARSGLINIEIPNSVTSIGMYAFYRCSSLTSITYRGTIAQWKVITKNHNWSGGVPSTCMVHCTDGDIAI